ncbi:prephenate dehydrogenase [Nanchangia anserum]|uniref:Prephenate dehydrogenase n=1 Tax=Nanchangia anserum TaxID=2692125 RepID=A0A8I0GES2_9ACTO|nr:prephenate dehydrogenase [Nanchangia anserum]MBD3688729.1 prephenate dehydrogenase [Nanchangia anserum]
MSAQTTGPVLIVGTGLLGTSIGMALRRLGVEVELADASPSALALARDMGAGMIAHEGVDPALVVVATPPDVTARVIDEALREHPRAIVTDVASVKTIIARELEACGADTTRYVGSHPMAGRERSGAGAADADLFRQRPWVIAPVAGSAERAIRIVRSLALDVGALPLDYRAEDHDAAVACVSHVPQLMASLLAASLTRAPQEALGLSGQGLRDSTRIAHSDPRLWAAIVGGNSREIAEVLRGISRDLLDLLHSLDSAAGDPLAPGLVAQVTKVLEAGNDGVERIPGKHGGAPRRYAEVSVLVPDTPGHLGRLFTELGEADVNIEDFALEHSAGAPMGVGRVLVDPAAAAPARAWLTDHGWTVLDGAH